MPDPVTLTAYAALVTAVTKLIAEIRSWIRKDPPKGESTPHVTT